MALLKAGEVSQEFDAVEAQLLTHQVTKVLCHRFSDRQIPDVEAIQDIVEQVLIPANHLKTARANIVYREQHRQLRRDKRTLVDVSASIDEYLDRSDWRVQANTNHVVRYPRHPLRFGVMLFDILLPPLWHVHDAGERFTGLP